MAVVAPPRPPRREDPDATEALDALIEDARRRARRRRRWYGLAVLATAFAAIAGFLAFRAGGGVSAEPRAVEPSPRVQPVTAPRATKNGALTIMAVPVNARQEGPPGWYGLSAVGADGQLHILMRCPHRVSFCGESESIDWSPNGRWLALSVTSFGMPNPYNGIHVINPATGVDLQVRRCQQLPGECDWFDLDWSPDGKRLAYASGGTIAIVDVLPRLGDNRRVLLTGTVGHDSSPSWSPDGLRIAYATRYGDRRWVSTIAVDGSGRRRLVSAAATPAWSPLGTTIAVRRQCGFRLVDPATGADVTPPRLAGCLPGAPYGRAPRLGPPVWSPDGKKLAFVAEGYGRPGSPRPDGTYVMNRDGSGRARLTTNTLGVHVGQQARAAWRPRR
jgi:Tol biopolymer transport system component